MFKHLVRNAFRRSRAAALLALSVGCGGANAAIYTGFWDPLFNATFSGAVGQDVYWKGSVFLTVADGCLTAGPSPIPGTTPGCSAASVDGYSVTFYDPVGPVTNPNILTTVGAGLFPSISQLFFGGSGSLTGIDLAGPIGFDVDGVFPQNYNALLDFSSIGASLQLSTDNGGCEFECPPINVYTSATTPTVTFTQVPEPASLALVGLALAALGVSRRGRR